MFQNLTRIFLLNIVTDKPSYMYNFIYMLVVNFNVLVTLAPYNLAIVFCVLCFQLFYLMWIFFARALALPYFYQTNN